MCGALKQNVLDFPFTDTHISFLWRDVKKMQTWALHQKLPLRVTAGRAVTTTSAAYRVLLSSAGEGGRASGEEPSLGSCSPTWWVTQLGLKQAWSLSLWRPGRQNSNRRMWAVWAWSFCGTALGFLYLPIPGKRFTLPRTTTHPQAHLSIFKHI
jgi:hypothetical protein